MYTRNDAYDLLTHKLIDSLKEITDDMQVYDALETLSDEYLETIAFAIQDILIKRRGD